MSPSCHARLKESPSLLLALLPHPPIVLPSRSRTRFPLLRGSLSLSPSFHCLRLATCSRRRDTATFRHLPSCPLYIRFLVVLVTDLPCTGTLRVLPNRRPGCISAQSVPPATILLSRLSRSLLSLRPRREDCRIPLQQRQNTTNAVSTATHQDSKLLEESQ